MTRKKVHYIAVDKTANINPYLTLFCDKFVWGPRFDDAHRFDDPDEAKEKAVEAMPFGEKQKSRIAIDPV